MLAVRHRDERRYRGVTHEIIRTLGKQSRKYQKPASPSLAEQSGLAGWAAWLTVSRGPHPS